MPGFIGAPELIILAVVALLVFGPKRLPELGRSLGHGMREFKDSVTGKTSSEHVSERDTIVEPPAITTGTAQHAATTTVHDDGRRMEHVGAADSATVPADAVPTPR